jgi:ABC-type branched-subunit amino acid transport system ATPase component
MAKRYCWLSKTCPRPLALGNRHLILSKGEICYSGNSAELDGNETALRDYLGV